MPRYDFQCANCQHLAEYAFPTYTASVEHPPTCPVCQVVMERQVSAPSSIVFRGSGFYATDYQHKSVTD